MPLSFSITAMARPGPSFLFVCFPSRFGPTLNLPESRRWASPWKYNKIPCQLYPSQTDSYLCFGLLVCNTEIPLDYCFDVSLLAWGLTMAAYRTDMPIKDYWWSMLNCVFGAIILRTSACTINDILDRKVDAGVGKPGLSLLQRSTLR